MIFTSRASSTYDLLSTFRSQTSQLQNRLNEASQEVATGKKANVYKSLGFGASEVLSLRAEVNRNDGFITSNQLLASKLEVTSGTLKDIRTLTQDFLNTAIPNSSSPTTSAVDLQAAAISALEQVTAHLNRTYQNAALFSGIDSDKISLQNFTQVNPTTGLSPSDALASVVGAGITNLADANQKIGEIEDIFTSNDTLQPNRNFEATFYNGSPLLQPGGSETARLQGQIDKNATLPYGIQANDPEFTNILRGLSIIASTDVSQIADEEAYSAWVGSAVDALTAGVSGLINVEANLGRQQKALDDKITAQQNLGDVFSSRVNQLEGVDLLEASTRVLQLETQLQASYTITSRISKLSFLNYV